MKRKTIQENNYSLMQKYSQNLAVFFSIYDILEDTSIALDEISENAPNVVRKDIIDAYNAVIGNLIDELNETIEMAKAFK